MAIPVIKVQAKHMRERTNTTRNDFVNNYTSLNQPYPVSKALRAVNLNTSNSSVLKLLLARKEFAINNGILENNIGVQVEAEFIYKINDGDFIIAVAFPKPLKSMIVYTDNNLTFNLLTPLPIYLKTIPSGMGIEVLPKQSFLTKLIISNENIVYELETNDVSIPKFMFIVDMTTEKYNLENTSMENGKHNSMSSMEDKGAFSNKIKYLLNKYNNEKSEINQLKLNYDLLSTGICPRDNETGWEPYSATTAHCQGIRVKRERYGNTYEFSCKCKGNNIKINVASGNDFEANNLVETEWDTICGGEI